MPSFVIDPLSLLRALAAVAALLAFFFCCALATSVRAQDSVGERTAVVLTPQDRDAAARFLEESRAELAAVLSGLSDKQLNYRSGDGRWSVAEVAEHLILTESTIRGLISENIAKTEPLKTPVLFRMRDGVIPLAITNRSQKFTAPPQIQPNGRWRSAKELISEFDKEREKTVSYVKTTDVDLRAHFGENPLFGMIDGYQWIIFLNAHTNRHLLQIEEIKKDAGFPGI